MTRRAGLAEVAEQLHATALDGLAQREHGVEVGAQFAPVLGVALGLVDHASLRGTSCRPYASHAVDGSPSRPVSW
nr:hypothetical protein GCM10025699_39620 [Microbacterium flavescens]